jgi:hypothetical protein
MAAAGRRCFDDRMPENAAPPPGVQPSTAAPRRPDVSALSERDRVALSLLLRPDPVADRR